MRAFMTVLLIVSAVEELPAQQAPCTVIANVVTKLRPLIPSPPILAVGKVYPPELWIPAQDLSLGAFVAREGRHPVPILSVETDEGPRRILLVIQVGDGVTEVWRQWQQVVATAVTGVLSKARPEDSFALLTAGNKRVALPFGSTKDAIRVAVEGLSGPPAGAPQGLDILDTLREATTWFGEPLPGDSIFFLGVQGHQHNGWEFELRSALARRRVRLFCLGGAYYTVGTDDFSTEWYSPLVGISESSGGGWEPFGVMPGWVKGADWNHWLAQEEAEDLYRMATFSYVLHLAWTGPHVKIELSDEAWHGLKWPRISYPNPLPVCPPPANASNSQRP